VPPTLEPWLEAPEVRRCPITPPILGADRRFDQIDFYQGECMFEGLLQPVHLLVICGLALLVFGPKKLPELGKGLGEGLRGFKAAMKTEDNLRGEVKKDP
jgi:TatA/E family protein of Tat protein translocase